MRGTSVRKAVVAGAVAAVMGSVSLGASAFAEGGTASHTASPKAEAAAAKPAAKPAAGAAGKDAKPAVVRQLVAKGRVDGVDWSVTKEFYPTLPKGYEPPAPPPGVPAGGTDPTSLLCQRMVIGGVRIDHQGGPWSDCEPVDGAHDVRGSGEEGLWGLHDQGTTGARLMVGNPAADVAYSVVTLADGTELTARRVGVPTTDYGTWAVAIPDGRTISTVDQFDAHHHLVSHETYWR